MPERLQKVLARAGFGSRRACETLIESGAVEVDGRTITKLGTKVDTDKQKIFCNGRRVREPKQLYLALNKPRRTISSTRDENGRRTIMDLIEPVRERVFPIGRLDYDSEGLILLTNDGEFCNLVLHPKYRIERTYHVVLRGRLTPAIIEKISGGVWLSDGRTGPVKVRVKKLLRDQTIAEVVVTEGINREVRRIFAKFGFKVQKLKWIKLGSISLGTLPRGACRQLSEKEIDGLRKLAMKNTRRIVKKKNTRRTTKKK